MQAHRFQPLRTIRARTAAIVYDSVMAVERRYPPLLSRREFARRYVRWGASPRASQYLVLGAKARAAVAGKLCADYDGVKSVARQVLQHRIITNFNARAQKITVPDIIEKILGDVKLDIG